MLLMSLLTVPLIAILAILFIPERTSLSCSVPNIGLLEKERLIAITLSILNIFISFVVFVVNIFSTNQYQLVEEYHKIGNFDFYLGIDGLSIYFVLLITIITPIALLSNWSSIKENIKPFLIIMLLLETLLLTVFIVLDTLLFYIFFESILPPLFLLIGIFGSKNRVRASFYLFLYTLLGSLFLLLCILNVSSLLGTSDFDMIYKSNIMYYTQVFIFSGIFIAFAVKTPTIFLNTWLLKAHVESPLGGSIILAAIVLKLSLYGILRLILPLLHKAYFSYTPVVYIIGVITILYASVSTLRTIDIKELIAYSSVSHAAVYLVGIFSSIIQGIQGGILLGLAHGFVSSGLFICTGGVLYDRSSTRLISFYRGFTQIMPLFVILFFILCLGNAGTPLSLNFVGEFLSLYGTFERIPLLGGIGCSSIVFSAAYTFYMFNRIAFAGTLSEFFRFNLPDLSKREFNILLILVVFTVVLGVYPAPVLDGLQYSTSLIIYNLSSIIAYCDGSAALDIDSVTYANNMEKLQNLHDGVIYYLVLGSCSLLYILVNAIKYYFYKPKYGAKSKYNERFNFSIIIIHFIYNPAYMIMIIYIIKELITVACCIVTIIALLIGDGLYEVIGNFNDIYDNNIYDDTLDTDPFLNIIDDSFVVDTTFNYDGDTGQSDSNSDPSDSSNSPSDSGAAGAGGDDDESEDNEDSSESNDNNSEDEGIPNEEPESLEEDLLSYSRQTDRLISSLGQMIEEHDRILDQGQNPREELVRAIAESYAEIDEREMNYVHNYPAGWSANHASHPDHRNMQPSQIDAILRGAEIQEEYDNREQGSHVDDNTQEGTTHVDDGNQEEGSHPDHGKEEESSHADDGNQEGSSNIDDGKKSSKRAREESDSESDTEHVKKSAKVSD